MDVAFVVHWTRAGGPIMRTFVVVASIVFGFLTPPAARAQQVTSTAESASSAIVVTGCVARTPDGKGYLLTSETGAASAPRTSSGTAPGTSATGDAPSGSVTADTPTGTTATETAVPTPPVGEPGTRVNPSSPTFNRGEGASGTGGTVRRADTAGAPSASPRYRLRAGKGINLAALVGHTVEVRGTLGPGQPAAADASPADSADAKLAVLTMESLTDRAATCTR
jgi:hypothetical protein